jgi:integrase/recombinase XerD
MELEEAIGEFLTAGLQSGWSRATHQQYRWNLERWRQWMLEHGVTRVDQVTKRALRQWGAGLREHWQKTTQRVAVSAVRGLMRWCQAEGIAPADLASAIKVPRPDRKMQRTLAEHEITRMLEECRTLQPSGIGSQAAEVVAVRNVAIISLLFDSLLRSAELCRLRVADLDLERRRLVVQVKGGDEAPGQFSPQTADYLRAWLSVRAAGPGVETVFVNVGGSKPGCPMTVGSLRQLLKRIGGRAGVPGVTTHSFRRGGAVAMVRNGAPTRIVQDYGRWSHIQMVEVYTRDLDAQDLYDRYSPIAKLNGKTHKGAD